MAPSSPGRIGSASAGANAAGKATTFCVVLSALLHLVLLVALIFIPELAPARRMQPSVVNVTLVSLPAAGSDTSPAAVPGAQSDTGRLQSPSPKADAKTAVPVAKPRAKTSMKRKTFRSSKVVKSAVDRIEKDLADSRPPSLDKALQRLKREVADSPDKPGSEIPPAGSTAAVGSGAAGGAQLSSGEMAAGIRIYQAEISYQIQKNWAFSEQLAGADKNLEVLMGIRIAPDGRITDTWFDLRSGNRHLDESAQRAIMKANPLPPLPQGLFDGDYTVGLRFGPEGVKR